MVGCVILWFLGGCFLGKVCFEDGMGYWFFWEGGGGIRDEAEDQWCARPIVQIQPPYRRQAGRRPHTGKLCSPENALAINLKSVEKGKEGNLGGVSLIKKRNREI